MFMSKSMLLCWKVDSVPLPLVIKPKVFRKLCNGAANASAKLRQTNRSDKPLELRMQLTSLLLNDSFL